MGQQQCHCFKANKDDLGELEAKSRDRLHTIEDISIDGMQDLTGKQSAQTIKNPPVKEFGLVMADNPADMQTSQAITTQSPQLTHKVDENLTKSTTESVKSKKSNKSMKKKKVKRSSLTGNKDDRNSEVQQNLPESESIIDSPDILPGRQSEIMMQKTESPKNKMMVGSQGTTFEMPNNLVDSIHHGEAAENAEFQDYQRGDSIIQMNQDTSFDPDNENLRNVPQPSPPGFEENSQDDETIKRMEDHGGSFHADDVEQNFNKNVEIGGRLNRNQTEIQFTNNQAANQRNRQLTQMQKANPSQQQDDMQSQASYMVKVDQNQLPDDMQSTGSYMVKVGDFNKGGPQPFDDVTSSGSYMVRGGTNNLPDDMQSTGSYMVKVGNGPKQFDDMSSQGSYMVKANENNVSKMNMSQFKDDDSQMVKGFDDPFAESQQNMDTQNNDNILDVESSGTFMGNQTQENINKQMERNDTTLQIGNNNLTQGIEFDDVESFEGQVGTGNANKTMNKSSTEMVIGQ